MSAIVKDYGSVVREIRTDIVVTSALPLTDSTGNAVSCSALWDTGANATVVSERVATALGLAPVGMVTVHTANGPYDTPIYAIDVMLPNNVMVKGIRATESDLQICDALIGMDIISLGDMLVTNAPNTKFEFRLPSKGAPTLA